MKKQILILAALALAVGGCKEKPATKQEQTAENSQNNTVAMPAQRYVGTWHTADNPPDDLTIFEIGNTIKFELGIFKITTANGTAKIEDNKIAFIADANFSGTMKFNENSILVTVDKSNFEYIKAGTTWNFTPKAEACKPSFDCKKASSKVEKMICDNNALACLDTKMSEAYSKARKGSKGEELLKTQRIFVKDRDKCGDTSCVENMYKARINLLEGTAVSIQYKIHKDVPDLLFSKNNSGERLEELVIVNSETKKTINKINLLDYTLFKTSPEIRDVSEIEFIDLNFDGYKDISIFDCYNGNWNKHFLYFVWDKSKNMFVPDTHRLNELGLPDFDEEKQIIRSMARGSATDHWYYTHKYIGGVLTLVEEKAETTVSFKDGVTDEQLAAIVPILSKYPSNTVMYSSVQKINPKTSKMETVEAKYQFYVPNEWKLIAEYDANSDIGKQLEKLVH